MQKIYFFTRSYEYMIPHFAEHCKIGKVDYKVFQDNEFYQRIISDVRGREVVIVSGTISDTDTLEIYDLAAGCAQYGALSIELVIPFYGYSTMERAAKYGEIVKAKSRAILLSEIPPTALGTKIFLFDLHSEGLTYYFNSNINTYHLRAETIWKSWILGLNESSLVIGSTDAGRAKWVEKLAQETHAEAAFIYKKRDDLGVKVSAINADVENKTVIVYDDMIRSGSSMIQAIKCYQEQGAKKIYCIATHGLMLDNSTERILELGVERLAITNSHPNATQQISDVEVLDISQLIHDVV